MKTREDVPKWLKERRNTGRTTRMLREVVKSCKPGATIVVVLPNEVEARHVRALFERSLPRVDGKYAFVREGVKTRYFGAQIDWKSCNSDEWDWMTMRFRNMHPECIVFVDPSCMELRFFELLDAWHRFDL